MAALVDFARQALEEADRTPLERVTLGLTASAVFASAVLVCTYRSSPLRVSAAVLLYHGLQVVRFGVLLVVRTEWVIDDGYNLSDCGKHTLLFVRVCGAWFIAFGVLSIVLAWRSARLMGAPPVLTPTSRLCQGGDAAQEEIVDTCTSADEGSELESTTTTDDSRTSGAHAAAGVAAGRSRRWRLLEPVNPATYDASYDVLRLLCVWMHVIIIFGHATDLGMHMLHVGSEAEMHEWYGMFYIPIVLNTGYILTNFFAVIYLLTLTTWSDESKSLARLNPLSASWGVRQMTPQ